MILVTIGPGVEGVDNYLECNDQPSTLCLTQVSFESSSNVQGLPRGLQKLTLLNEKLRENPELDNNF